jgi:phage shock protein PspC (stress-responsive transcriptional regulator)
MTCPQCKNLIEAKSYECKWCGCRFIQNEMPNNVSAMPKKLVRIKPKVLFGVCSGIANYFSIDVSFIRIFFVIGNLFFGLPFIIYIIMAIIIPSDY